MICPRAAMTWRAFISHLMIGRVTRSMFLLLPYLIGLVAGLTLVVISPSPDVFTTVSLPRSWLLYHRYSRAYLDFGVKGAELVLARHSPQGRCFVKTYSGRPHCPTRPDVALWVLAVLPSQQALLQALDVQTWLASTGFDDGSYNSLERWLDQRSQADPFALAIIYSSSAAAPSNNSGGADYSDGGSDEGNNVGWNPFGSDDCIDSFSSFSSFSSSSDDSWGSLLPAEVPVINDIAHLSSDDAESSDERPR